MNSGMFNTKYQVAVNIKILSMLPRTKMAYQEASIGLPNASLSQKQQNYLNSALKLFCRSSLLSFTLELSSNKTLM